MIVQIVLRRAVGPMRVKWMGGLYTTKIRLFCGARPVRMNAVKQMGCA